MVNTTLVFMIIDDKGMPISVQPSKLEARKEIAWFLPKEGISYSIVPTVVLKDKEMVQELDEDNT